MKTVLVEWWKQKTDWQFLKRLNINLSYDPATPLPGIYQEKWKHVHIKNTNRDSQKLEAIQIFNNRWTDKQIVV